MNEEILGQETLNDELLTRGMPPDRFERSMRMDRARLWFGGGLVILVALAYHVIRLAEVPPGLDRDAAANGWLALNWLRYGIVPFWMPHASAPEPLIVWLQTAITALMGPSVAALRLASALFLSAAAGAVYALTREVAKPFASTVRWWAAMFAGLIFACNPVITQLARTGLRATTLPLLSALFFLLLLRAWRTHARRDYLWSGLVLGVSAYTYLAARFLPFVVLLFVVVAWWVESRSRHSARSEESPSAVERGDSEESATRNDVDSRYAYGSRLIGLGLMGVVALVVVVPQLIFFGVYPSAFWERAQSVSLLANPAYGDAGLVKLLLDKVVGMVLMLGVQWSGQYNQAARPLLSPLPLAGLLLALPLVWRWRRQAAMILILITIAVMLLPDLIGGDRVQPHELRVIGAFVPLVILSGVGLASGVNWLLRMVGGRVTWHVAGALLAVLIVGWGVWDWFGVAAPALATSEYSWFAQPEVALAEAVNGKDAPVVMALNDYSRSVIAYLSAKRIAHLQSGIDTNGQVATPSQDQVYLLWPAAPDRTRVESTSYRFDAASLVLIDGDHAYLMPAPTADVAKIQQECDATPITTPIMTPAGEMAGTLCPVAYASFGFPTQLIEWRWPAADLYDGTLRLQGITADRGVLTPGATFGIMSFWHAEARTGDRWRYFVHLLNDKQELVAGDDLMPGYGVYDTRLWQTDEIMPIRQAIQLPDTLAPGRYWIEVGLYDPLNGQRAVVTGTGADRTLVGPLKMPLPVSSALTSATSLAAHFGDEIVLDAYQIERNDEEIAVSLQLAALRPPERDYTVFLHVEDAAGALVAQNDAQPLDGQYPTAIWDAGEQVAATWHVTLPASLTPGSYAIWLGLYDWETGERLMVDSNAAPVEANRLLLGKIELP